MSNLIGFKLPKIDWTPGPNLAQRLKLFKQKCKLLFNGPLKPRIDEQKRKYLLFWMGGLWIRSVQHMELLWW